MHASISRSVGMKLKTHFADWPVLFFERRDGVEPSKAVGNQTELRVLKRLGNRVSRIWNDEPARSAKHRVSMTNEALVGIVARAKSVRVGAYLREHGIELTRNRRAIRYVGAGVAGGFQLPGAQDAFFK